MYVLAAMFKVIASTIKAIAYLPVAIVKMLTGGY